MEREKTEQQIGKEKERKGQRRDKRIWM